VFTRAEFGTYRANEWHCESLPRIYTPGKRLVVWCHEHGASGLTWNAVRDAQGQSAIADAGLPAASADLAGPTSWGNDASVAAIDQLWTLMQTRWGVPADKLLLFAGSMGNLTAFNYLRANPTKVAAIASILPAVDLGFIHDSNPEANADPAEIEAAYGGLAAYTAALPTHSPKLHKAGGVPIRIWYSTDDPIALPATALQFASDVGASTVSLGAVGHTFGGAGFDRSTIANWLRQYA
jgi:hypothetical protein